MLVSADGIEGKDAENICQVADASEEEEQRVQALGAFATVVEQELGETAAKVQCGAEIAENLAGDVELQYRILLLRGLATAV